MPNWIHRTTKVFLPSVASADLAEAVANYILDPDLSAVAGFGSKYWTVSGDIISLMPQAERDGVDAAAVEAGRDEAVNKLDRLEDLFRAFGLALLDELNLHAARTTGILDAVDGANSLVALKLAISAIPDAPQRTIAQLKTAIRNKLGT